MSEPGGDGAGVEASAAAVVRVVLAVDPDRFADVVAELRLAGLVVDEQWPETGALAGRLQVGRLPAMRSIDGVVGIEPERFIQIPPSQTDTQ